MIYFISLIMTTIMIFSIKQKYTAVGHRREILRSFTYGRILTILSFSHDY
jgi:hypothetical protein